MQEEFKINGKDLVRKIKELFHEGNKRKVIVKSEKENVMAEIPLTYVVIGSIIAPVIAIILVLIILLIKYSIVIKKK